VSLLAQDERLTRRVGAVTLVLLALAIGFVIFVYDRLDFGRTARVRIYMTASGGLQEGAPFIVAGRAIGKVESIALVPRGSSPLLDDEEGVAVTVALDADSADRVVRSGDVFVTSRGVLGARYLEIGPPREPAPTLRDGDELRGRDPPSLDRVLHRTWSNLTTAAAFAAAIRPEYDALIAELAAMRETLAELAPGILLENDIDALLEEGRRTYAALGGDAGIDRISRLGDRVDTMIGQARTSIAKLRTSADALAASIAVVRARLGAKGGQLFDKVDFAIARVREAIAKADPLLAQLEALEVHIARGEGSLLKLARDPEFPEDAKALGKILKRQPWKIIDRPAK
jgi:phospholipid/cholesterol/gamma-HCH transport system substrate-binding protein